MEFLVSGHIGHVDEEDAHLFAEYKWFASSSAKSRRHIYIQCKQKIDGKTKNVPLHRAIAKAAPGTIVDHRDCDTLNCRRDNLRVGNLRMNARNASKRANATSKFKGVSWWTHGGIWKAQIWADGRNTSLGYFKNEVEAAFAYDQASVVSYGEHGKRNFLPLVT